MSSSIAWTHRAAGFRFPSPASTGSRCSAPSVSRRWSSRSCAARRSSSTKTVTRSCGRANAPSRAPVRSRRRRTCSTPPHGTTSIGGRSRAATSGSARRREYLPADVRPYASTFDQYGSWQYEQPYGYVWYPRAYAGWRPYYRGRWVSLRPYGWTWIGGDPWGWPTHHYGRWGFSGSGWFWIPGRHWGAAWVSWGYAPGYVSWCPLGWNNRPVFSLVNVNIYGGRRYDGWHGWNVVPRRHFGYGYANTHIVAGHRLDGRTRGAFVVRDSSPDWRARGAPRLGADSHCGNAERIHEPAHRIRRPARLRDQFVWCDGCAPVGRVERARVPRPGSPATHAGILESLAQWVGDAGAAASGAARSPCRAGLRRNSRANRRRDRPRFPRVAAAPRSDHDRARQRRTDCSPSRYTRRPEARRLMCRRLNRPSPSSGRYDRPPDPPTVRTDQNASPQQPQPWGGGSYRRGGDRTAPDGGVIAIARFRARTHRGRPKHPGRIRHRARRRRHGRTKRHERRRAASRDRLRTAAQQSVVDRRHPRPTGRHDPRAAGAKDPVRAVTALAGARIEEAGRVGALH